MLHDTGLRSSGSAAAGRDTHVNAHFTAEGSEHLGWSVDGATVTTKLNHPYLVEIDLQTDRLDVDPAALFGASSELRIQRDELENSYGGIISSVRTLRRGDMGVRARVTLEPALAALRHGRDTRIFQDMTVPEVLEAVLNEELGPYGRGVRLELRRSYPKREYNVQYQESHFEFVHRMMEEEGIIYYFAQEGALEVMVLIDSTAQHPRIAPSPLLTFSEVGGESVHGQEFVTEFDRISNIGINQIATRHFDWTHPSAIINGRADGSADAPVRESYEHDEPFTLHGFSSAYQATDVADQVRLRRDQAARPQDTYEGIGTVTGLRTGLRFDLNGHTDGLDASYVVVEMRHFFGRRLAGAGIGDQAQMRYVNRFKAVAAESPWRPIRQRSRPRIRGIQTAIVTGPPGEEIHCDEHGRIKVQFHWDREGQMDDRTSCWIRCMQTAAGSGFGAWVLPRVGWEVVVAFVDGDPDRPLVTGCVYNGDLPLPYALPEKKMVTTFKSNSYPGGNGFNELRLDDTKQAEEIFLHGEKDWNTIIKHDHTRQVGNDETQSVGHDRTRQVANDETLSVGNNRTRMVGVNETVTVGANESRIVGANRSRMVGVNETIAIGVDQSTQVGANRSTAIGANDALQVAADQALTVAGSQSVKIGVSASHQVGKSADYKVGASLNEKVGKMRKRKVGIMEMVNVGVAQMINVTAARMVTVGMVHMINAGMMLMLNAGKKLELKCGSAKISMSSSGKIEISGAEVNILASGNVNAKGAMIHLN
jgi:type VI secretion system secreted protein VgrG